MTYDNRYADGHTITIHQSFIHDYTYTANCLFDSQSPTHRVPVADQSQTSCRPIATYFQSVGNQSPTSRRPIADWSPIFRDSSRRPVADWSATEKRSFWSHSGCIGCSCFLVARQSPTGCSTCVTGDLHTALYTDRFYTYNLFFHCFLIFGEFNFLPKKSMFKKVFLADHGRRRCMRKGQYDQRSFVIHDDVIKWKHFSALLAICAGNSLVTG